MTYYLFIHIIANFPPEKYHLNFVSEVPLKGSDGTNWKSTWPMKVKKIEHDKITAIKIFILIVTGSPFLYR